MTPLEYILSGLVSLLLGYLTYRSTIRGKQIEAEQLERKDEHEVDQAFISTLVGRVETLENRYDTLQDKIALSQKQSEDDRRKIIDEYERKVEALRIEMRKLLDNATLELATWRDKYFTLVQEYQIVKAENSAIKLQLERLEGEYTKLKTAYEQKFRHTRDLLDTP